MARHAPLVKLGADGQAILSPDGCELISSLPGALHVAFFVGPRGSGKSTLASELLELQPPLPEATEGIEVAALALSAEATGSAVAGHLLVLDCTATDTAETKAVRKLASALRGAVSADVLHVTSEGLGEATLDSLGGDVEDQYEIFGGSTDQLPKSRLIFVASKGSKTLAETALSSGLSTHPSRKLITSAYASRRLFNVRHRHEAPSAFKKDVTALREHLAGVYRPSESCGYELHAGMLLQLLQNAVGQLGKDKIDMEFLVSKVKNVGFIEALSTRLWESCVQAMPADPSSYDPKFQERDPRKHVLAKFDREVAYLRGDQDALVEEERRDLKSKLDAAWETAEQCNNEAKMVVEDVLTPLTEKLLHEAQQTLSEGKKEKKSVEDPSTELLRSFDECTDHMQGSRLVAAHRAELEAKLSGLWLQHGTTGGDNSIAMGRVCNKLLKEAEEKIPGLGANVGVNAVDDVRPDLLRRFDEQAGDSVEARAMRGMLAHKLKKLWSGSKDFSQHPIAVEMWREVQRRMPRGGAYDRDLAQKDPRGQVQAMFAERTAALGEDPEIDRVWRKLEEHMSELWNTALKLNEECKVVLEGFLNPLCEKLLAEALASLPKDGAAQQSVADPRPNAAKKFRQAVEEASLTDRQIRETFLDGIAECPLVGEALDRLTSEIDGALKRAGAEDIFVRRGDGSRVSDYSTVEDESVTGSMSANSAAPEEPEVDVATETIEEVRTVMGSCMNVPLAEGGLLSKVDLVMQEVIDQSRAVILMSSGRRKFLEWEQKAVRQRFRETAFEALPSLPTLVGELRKRSPNVLRMAFGGAGLQTRKAVVRDGHLVWWDEKKVNTDFDKVSGCMNFFLNKACIVIDLNDPDWFSLKPKDEDNGWWDPSSFSGGTHREIAFCTKDTDQPRSAWVSTIQKHIDFADEATKQLGLKRTEEYLSTALPTLGRVMWDGNRVSLSEDKHDILRRVTAVRKSHAANRTRSTTARTTTRVTRGTMPIVDEMVQEMAMIFSSSSGGKAHAEEKVEEEEEEVLAEVPREDRREDTDDMIEVKSFASTVSELSL